MGFLAPVSHYRLVNVTGFPRVNTFAIVRAYIFLPRHPRCTPPAKRRHRLGIFVPMLSHRVFLRGRWHTTCGGRCVVGDGRQRSEGGACGTRCGAQRSAPCRESSSLTHTAASPSPRTLACAPPVQKKRSPYRTAPA